MSGTCRFCGENYKDVEIHQCKDGGVGMRAWYRRVLVSAQASVERFAGQEVAELERLYQKESE